MKIILFIALLVLSIGLLAQDSDRQNRLAKRLDLTAEQVEQFQTIMEERQAIAEQAKVDANARLATVLTEEQYQQWAELQERRQMRKEQRRARFENTFGNREPIDLTDEQKEQLQMVLEESRDRIMAIKEETEASLSTFLTEEQVAQVKRRLLFKRLRRGS